MKLVRPQQLPLSSHRQATRDGFERDRADRVLPRRLDLLQESGPHQAWIATMRRVLIGRGEPAGQSEGPPQWKVTCHLPEDGQALPEPLQRSELPRGWHDA